MHHFSRLQRFHVNPKLLQPKNKIGNNEENRKYVCKFQKLHLHPAISQVWQRTPTNLHHKEVVAALDQCSFSNYQEASQVAFDLKLFHFYL